MITAIIPVFFLVVWRCRTLHVRRLREVKQRTAVINADIESGLSGIRTAKAFANEEAELEKFDASNDSFKTSKRQFHKAMGRFNAVMEFFFCILSVAVIAVGGWLIMQGQMNTVDLITFSLYITTFVNPVRKLSNFAELFANGTAGFPVRGADAGGARHEGRPGRQRACAGGGPDRRGACELCL
ncbi:MAG: ABC transporter transmembrane domain-containing protein [Dysosmobacter sp.]